MELNDEALAAPEVQRKLSILRGLGDTSAYGALFDPLAFVGALNVGLSLGLELVVLYFRVNHANRWLLGLSTAFMVLQKNLDGSPSAVVVDHVDTTHDGFLRLQNLYKLGTSSALRKEVNTLGLQDFILEEAEAARASIGAAATTPVSSSPLDNSRRSMRRAAGAHRSFAWRPILAELERPLTYVIFILMSAAQQDQGGSSLLAFADVATLENSTRSCHYRFHDLRSYVVELSRGLESMAAYYEMQELGRASQRPLGHLYQSASVNSTEGAVHRGMRIDFRDVTFIYPGATEPALNNVSFTVQPGELVALVGSNGCGKSTLISVLAMHERNYEGCIFINGVNMKAYSRRELLHHMSFTFQHTPALPSTVREFVGLGSVEDRHIDALVLEALQTSGANEVLERLPDDWNTFPAGPSESNAADPWESLESAWDYPRVSGRPLAPPSLKPGSGYDIDAAFSWLDDADTKVGSGNESADEKDLASSFASLDSAGASELTSSEDATREYAVRIAGEPARLSFPLHSPSARTLSSGQWQRIVLARSLLKGKKAKDLLVFDEPGAALDPAAENSMFEAILSRRGQSTVMFSTHRFGITCQADRILCFDAGRLVEDGTHESLLALEGGQYRAFWEIQAKGFETQA